MDLGQQTDIPKQPRRYLGQVSDFTRLEIYKFRHIGVTSLCELQQLMDKYKLKFKGE